MTNEHFENSGYQPTNSDILERFKELKPEIPTHTVVSLDGVAECIGGFKSGRFNPDIVHQLRERGIPAVHIVAASGLQAFAEHFEGMERLADSLYDIALERAQDAIAAATAQGATPEMLLVPDSVNESAHDYCHRLARLAQDTGLPVAINMWVEDYEGFTIMEPPTAPSVEAFYEAVAPECQPFERSVYANSMDAHILDQWGALIDGKIEKWPNFSLMQEALPILARHGRPEDLQAFFADPANSEKLEILKNLAFAEHSMYSRDHESNHARHILAKLDDPGLRETIIQEYIQEKGRYGYKEATSHPIGIYMRNDDQLFEEGKRKVLESLDSEDTTAMRDFYFYGQAVAFSQRLDVADWLAALPQLAPQTPRAQRSAYSYIVDHAPDYAAIISTMPCSPDQIRSEATLKAFLVDTLTMFMQDENEELVKGINHRPPTERIADTLIAFHDPMLRPLLKAHVLHFFEECGSVLIGESMGKHTFLRHYFAYKKVYGPIAEIDGHIKITPS